MLDSLPARLADRSRLANQNKIVGESGPVVVWLKSSLRVHENPALDIGRIIASRNNLPLLVYQAIDERYPWASLRHHNMLLDGAVDLHHGCEALGLRYVLHVAREGNRQPVMDFFAQEASCIITDLFPLPPWSQWVKSVASRAVCPFIEVDCHCVIPMTLYGRSVDRPFKFRSATKKLRKRLLGEAWEKVEVEVEGYLGELPFTPVDVVLDIEDFRRRFELLRKCSIDPTVLPVWSERGGERVGLSRWQEFLNSGLRSYAKRRNNAADSQGVSRMSAAFHYGFVSPMMVARDAASIGTKSSEKYLDELLIFREHAWHHAASLNDPYDSSNLPEWALESWAETEDDPRPELQTGQGLEFANTTSHLWNLCQRSLLYHGELHNNLRMTWGKAFPPWTTCLEDSLKIAQKLNDKYALDGRDPSSVAGVQWCHGLFDRPFHPSAPIMGTVRQRSIATHASRLDIERYGSHVERRVGTAHGPILVAGTGVIFDLLANVLRDNGLNVLRMDSSEGSTSSKLDFTDLEILDFVSDRIRSPTSHEKRNEEGLPSQDIIAVIHDSSDDIGSIVGDSGLYVSEKAIYTPIEVGFADAPSFNEASRVALWELAGTVWSLNTPRAPLRYSIQEKLF
tara:strand:- start:1638 stop:3509 length:1872 start_codon:yes stop_codon:yes gene_type:complete